jgi:hypothetical protein
MLRALLVISLLFTSASRVWAYAQSENHNLSCCNKAGGGCKDSEGLPLPACPQGNTADSALVQSGDGPVTEKPVVSGEAK